ncbi:MAG TPA: glycine cleavage system protein GcvH [Caldisericia bacterium]|nr:glycine cleavage system protein GcvH [Caldisericia bacterium]HPF49644.1 glycine cleavage system protein GcvH [Caldisericia bacterium]HPI84626.1 glycine cleavage system protein GcvH [Caldisericia bacterium]HPQ92164.1 glycine cleavage system protein GcvH [Caldisericia bacterium]HRV74738.1 glycine cleavage system protein GcvH [Caldisericia bacterium]
MPQIGDYNLPDDLFYHREHYWVKKEGNIATIGIDDFGTKLAGEISFIELPMEDDEVEFDEQVGSLETGKWLGKVYSPVSGTVVEVNEDATDDPIIINNDPYGKGWLFKIEMSNEADLEKLVTGDAITPWLEKEIETRGK